MKILFLDCDGVLNNRATFIASIGTKYATTPLDSLCVDLVEDIILTTRCKVVLSSTWRHFSDWPARLGKLSKHIIGTTPILHSIRGRDGGRGQEIQKWMTDNLPFSKSRYAILDDNTDFLPEQLPNFFKTETEIGITLEIAKKVAAHLRD